MIISKQAVAEKQPLTLEEYNEEQSKCYLSYPKPPVLDMKWANCDINFAEWANIPKFSTLDDIVTHLRLLELFFDDVLVDIIFGYTKLYSHREKAGISFKITNEKFYSISFHSISFQTIKLLVGDPWYFCVSKVWFNTS